VNWSSPLFYLVLLFPISELTLAVFKRAKSGAAKTADQHSLGLLWFVIAASVALAIWATWNLPSGHIHFSRTAYVLSVASLFLLGFAIRWHAIWTLGKFFTVNVAIHGDHKVVQSGLYKYIRHPSYTGALICMLALGLYFANVFSLLLLFVPVFLALRQRMNIEERALIDGLGEAYTNYCKRTKRLLPGIY
jgi:protein-S-isoprenylcysteine O-methyltransferase